MPPEPMRCVVDTRLQLRDGFVPSARARERAAERTVDLQRYRKPMATLVPPLVKRAGEAARSMAVQRIAAALAAANALLGHALIREIPQLPVCLPARWPETLLQRIAG